MISGAPLLTVGNWGVCEAPDSQGRQRRCRTAWHAVSRAGCWGQGPESVGVGGGGGQGRNGQRFSSVPTSWAQAALRSKPSPPFPCCETVGEPGAPRSLGVLVGVLGTVPQARVDGPRAGGGRAGAFGPSATTGRLFPTQSGCLREPHAHHSHAASLVSGGRRVGPWPPRV